jgi:hypothetical protein
MANAIAGHELSGQIFGTVLTPDGREFPNVMISLTGAEFGPKRTIANARGQFRFVAVPRGVYELRCEMEGIRTVVSTGVEVLPGRTTSLTITMEL